MQSLSWLLGAFFLPLFPMSLLFSRVWQGLGSTRMRVLLILLWPLPGVFVLDAMDPLIPSWLAIWALATSMLYGLRAVAIKEASVWVGYMAISAWSLGWLIFAVSDNPVSPIAYVLSFSASFALLTMIIGEIEHGYGAAYAGIVTGLAQDQKALSALFVIFILSAIATPFFPTFFVLLGNIAQVSGVRLFAAVIAALVWLVWSWSAMRLIQGLLVGTSGKRVPPLLTKRKIAVYGVLASLLVVSALIDLGGLR